MSHIIQFHVAVEEEINDIMEYYESVDLTLAMGFAERLGSAASAEDAGTRFLDLH